jgi:8-oxo-dGTP diphosphatase
MARTPILAAGGIVMRSDASLIALVRMRKRDHWVLPKGKLDDGETARVAAEREVIEETGHDVTVHEFVGTMAYEASGRPKIVHFWRMEADGPQCHPLMRDIKAVAWLPLESAIARLSRDHERSFLAEVGPPLMAAASRRVTKKVTKVPVRRPEPVEVEIIEPVALPAPAQLPMEAVVVTPPPASPALLPDITNAPALVPAPRPALLSRVWKWLVGG